MDDAKDQEMNTSLKVKLVAGAGFEPATSGL